MAQFAQANGPKLTAGNPVGSAVGEGFSAALSTDGTTAIIGAPFDNSGAGAAWIFKRNNGTWTQQQKLTADDAAGCSPSNLSACPQFGWSVALSADGNTAIVGGPGDNGLNGAAWVFTQSNGVWSQVGAKLTGTGAVGSAEQGYSVALSADGATAIIGGWADNSALGAAWVFSWSGTNWNQQGAKLVGNNATDTVNILQGFSVALSGDGNLAIIGGPNDGASIGAAWLFSRSAGSWTQATKLVGMNGNESEQGFSVALSRDGGTAIVGGPGQETPGTGTSGAISQTCSTGGTDPSCSGGTITNTTETTPNMSNGAAWVFTRSSGVWGPGTMLAGTSAPISSPGQGFSVALSDNGSTLLLGGPTDNANTGAVWAFTLNSGTWTPQANTLVGTGVAGAAGQGASVALSHNGGTAIIGGALDQNATGAAWSFVFNFALTVTVSDSSGGTITSSPFNINCQTTCGSSQPSGTLVTFTATPLSGYTFGGWSGACSGTGSCVVTISMAENVTATFYVTPTRTFVSGSVGDDTTQCSRTAPCRTFAGAISKTAAGGEIDVLDPGGFGTVTITQAITIDGGGTEASILASATNGININAGSTDTVILRHLSINGAGTTIGLNGINFLAGSAVIVDNCTIFNFSQSGISAAPSSNANIAITNTKIINSATGILLSTVNGGAVQGIANHVTIQNSPVGVSATGSGGASVAFTVSNSAITNATTSAGSAANNVTLNFDSSSIANNTTAFTAATGGYIRVSRNLIYNNATNYSISGGKIAAAGNNDTAVNGAGVPNATITQQ